MVLYHVSLDLSFTFVWFAAFFLQKIFCILFITENQTQFSTFQKKKIWLYPFLNEIKLFGRTGSGIQNTAYIFYTFGPVLDAYIEQFFTQLCR